MRRAALAEVELDRVRVPRRRPVADDDEVEREAADHALAARAARRPSTASRVIAAAYPGRPGSGSRGSVWPLGPPSSWSCVESSSTSPSGVTRSWTLGLRNSSPGDPLLDDAAALGELRQRSRRSVTVGDSKLIARTRSLDRARLAVGARRGQAAQVDDRVALARHALVQLDDHLLDLRAARRAVARSRSTTSSSAVQVLHAERMRHALLGEQPPAAGLRPEVEVPRVGAVHRDAERQREVALELGRVVRDEVRAVRVGDQRRGCARAAAAARAASRVSGRASRRAARRGTAAAARARDHARAAGRGSSRRCSG